MLENTAVANHLTNMLCILKETVKVKMVLANAYTKHLDHMAPYASHRPTPGISMCCKFYAQ